MKCNDHYQSEDFFGKLFNIFIKTLAHGSVVVAIVTIQSLVISWLLLYIPLYVSEHFCLYVILSYLNALSAVFYAFASRACRGYLRTNGRRYYLKLLNNSIAGFVIFLVVVLYLLMLWYYV